MSVSIFCLSESSFSGSCSLSPIRNPPLTKVFNPQRFPAYAAVLNPARLRSSACSSRLSLPFNRPRRSCSPSSPGVGRSSSMKPLLAPSPRLLSLTVTLIWDILAGLLIYEALLAPSEDPGVHPCESKSFWPSLDSERVHAVLLGSWEILARLGLSLAIAQSAGFYPIYFRGPDRPIASDDNEGGYRNGSGIWTDCIIAVGLAIATSLGKLKDCRRIYPPLVKIAFILAQRHIAPPQRSPRVPMTMASSASEADGNGTSSTGDVRGSQGSDDQIVKNMAKALKESVSPILQFKTLNYPI